MVSPKNPLVDGFGEEGDDARWSVGPLVCLVHEEISRLGIKPKIRMPEHLFKAGEGYFDAEGFFQLPIEIERLKSLFRCHHIMKIEFLWVNDREAKLPKIRVDEWFKAKIKFLEPKVISDFKAALCFFSVHIFSCN